MTTVQICIDVTAKFGLAFNGKESPFKGVGQGLFTEGPIWQNIDHTPPPPISHSSFFFPFLDQS